MKRNIQRKCYLTPCDHVAGTRLLTIVWLFRFRTCSQACTWSTATRQGFRSRTTLVDWHRSRKRYTIHLRTCSVCASEVPDTGLVSGFSISSGEAGTQLYVKALGQRLHQGTHPLITCAVPERCASPRRAQQNSQRKSPKLRVPK